MRGQVQLKLRVPGSPASSVVLPFDWQKAVWGDAYVRIRNIFALVHDGYTLRQAAEVAAGKAPKLIDKLDWNGASDRFKEQKINHGNAIKLSTWERKYSQVVFDAIELLTSRNPPTTPAVLIDRCIRQWEPGSRTRQERARNLCQFLRHCVGIYQQSCPPVMPCEATYRIQTAFRLWHSNRHMNSRLMYYFL